MSFNRIEDPLGATGSGLRQKWLKEWGIENYNIHKDGKISVSGDVILEVYNLSRPPEIPEYIHFRDITGSFIIGNVKSDYLYIRIKKNIESFLFKWFNMDGEEKEKYCAEKGKSFRGRYFSADLVFSPEKIDKSISYVHNLKDSPTEDEMNELAVQVKSGILEWAYPHQDEFAKTMGSYAHQILGDR